MAYPAIQSTLIVLLLGMFMLALGCTGSQLGGTSKGWSAAAVSEIYQNTGSRVDERGTFLASDTTLTVTDSRPFQVQQTLHIDNEQLKVQLIRGNNLEVERGVNGTRPGDHADGSDLRVVATVVYVATNQGEIKALSDGGSGPPSTNWTFNPKKNNNE
jgi:hypothetical protein